MCLGKDSREGDNMAVKYSSSCDNTTNFIQSLHKVRNQVAIDRRKRLMSKDPLASDNRLTYHSGQAGYIASRAYK